MDKIKKAVWFIAYKLKKGASEQDFLVASKALRDGYVCKQKGYISWIQLKDNDIWVDLATWESMEDAKSFEKGDGTTNPLSEKFYSFINFNSLKSQFYTVEN
jgi:hypothetical protein